MLKQEIADKPLYVCQHSSETTMHVISYQKYDTMKTLLIGAAGTTLSISLEQYSAIASAGAATLTSVYMLFKCIDWMIEKLQRKYRKPAAHAPHKSHHHHPRSH